MIHITLGITMDHDNDHDSSLSQLSIATMWDRESFTQCAGHMPRDRVLWSLEQTYVTVWINGSPTHVRDVGYRGQSDFAPLLGSGYSGSQALWQRLR